MTHRPRLRRAILAFGAALGTASAALIFATPAHAATTVTFADGVLTITGDAGDNGLVVGSISSEDTIDRIITLNGTEVLGGTVPVAAVSVLRMEGGEGNDIVTFDQSNGVLPPGELIGGPGNDKLTGGSGADTLIGGEATPARTPCSSTPPRRSRASPSSSRSARPGHGPRCAAPRPATTGWRATVATTSSTAAPATT
jgi:hypothetical protein